MCGPGRNNATWLNSQLAHSTGRPDIPAQTVRGSMNFEGVDPAEHRRPRPQLSRRRLLQGTLWLGAGVGVTPLLSACGNDKPAEASGKTAPYRVAPPNNPATRPIKDSNPPIGDGLDPETGGVFQILNYD